MNVSKKTTLVAAATLCFALVGSAIAGSHGGGEAQKDAAEYRQSTFTMVKHHFGIMGAMAKGKIDFDAETFARNAEAVAALSQLAPTGFEVEGLSDDTSAKAAIWKEKADFSEKMTAFQDAAMNLAKVAQEGDEGKSKAAFGAVAKTCKGCHTDYRTKKK